ncbi:hypothetical protein PVT68_10415 [Microbulbifer bruguierae]|uniref:DUF3784 domain-containing protein n=1 Tax=Microbulbifer bruguierae TaxID=3029061 RepID=A0ABY8NAS4_9GAMM|nr:hypothetical protein [Microbulbifer bruguierae]WGL15187.1 hypothetical protein PVT68_10415 [Microbulbifer bruguierae]
MNDQSQMLPILLLLLGVFPLMAFSYAIGVKKKYDLIAGWKESGMREIPELAVKIGRSSFIAGMTIAVAAAGSYFGFLSDGWIAVICVASCLYVAIQSIYASVNV